MSPQALSALKYAAYFEAAYNSILNVVPQRYPDSVTLSHSSFQQAPRQISASSVKVFVCQVNSLVARNDSVSHVKYLYGAFVPNAYAVRSPKRETIERKCWPTVCSSNGGYST